MPIESRVILTKLFRPEPPKDVIARPRLLARLDQGKDAPLTLVSAPAGYGKSTLVSQWLGSFGAGETSAWYSADPSDNDPESFFLHLVSAIQVALPGACEDSAKLARSNRLPDHEEVVRLFSNELLKLEGRVYLVVDDFHFLSHEGIRDLLNLLLAHPPSNFHLILVTRRDPPILLNRHRRQGQLNEFRLGDLRFNEQEVDTFMEANLPVIRPAELKELALRHLEGWPVALRLLIVALRDTKDVADFTRRMPAAPALVSNFLIEGILDQIDAERLAAMLGVSLVDRFNIGLCDAMFPGLDGREFVDWLVASDLFVIPLDKDRGWFRFHHLFQDTLQAELKLRQSPEEIRGTHQRAAMWFASQELIGEALDHLLKADDLDAVTDLLVAKISNMENPPGRDRTTRWFAKVPQSVIDAHPVLLGTRCIQLIQDVRIAEAYETADRLEAALVGFDGDAKLRLYLHGVAVWACTFQLAAEKKWDEIVTRAEGILDQLWPEETELRGLLCMPLSNACRAHGDVRRARESIDRIRRELEAAGAPYPEAFHSECHLNFHLGDSRRLSECSGTFLEHCREHGFRSYAVNARFQSAWASYQLNDLETAAGFCAERDDDVVLANPQDYLLNRRLEVMICLARGQVDESRELLVPMHGFLDRHKAPRTIFCYESTRALVALREGHLSEALAWVDSHGSRPFVANLLDDFAGIPLQILLATNTPESLRKAGEILGRTVDAAAEMNSVAARFELLALRALWNHAMDRGEESLADLREALHLAQPGGSVRVFADIAASLPLLLTLLQKLELDEEGIAYVGSIWGAASVPSATSEGDVAVEVPRPPAGSLVEALSKREYEVLLHAAKRLSNREIAETLFISPGTVKRHLNNIYEKLGVHGRKEAVAKATGLGLLQ
ncbi:protein/transcriptional regulator, LuxR family [Haloferula helveola]|uniref:Protein/transcriptional regulator, LuxR family n=1 Tax=Haloferula helveola TaxID=490095 RepID=A0ABM7RJD5_9BACT|nr:protein/transcriptional regulator, LuxR family [Haloferula helveola]